jgi:myo-inositol-1(or 4)-monophosphatase
MDIIYKKIIDKVLASGKRLRERAGKIRDIGITKRDLTEEDIRIERELKEIINEFNPEHGFYAEEENADFFQAEDVWVADPISGTKIFINGSPHYGIVVSHLHNQKVQFAVVYDPSVGELYTAYRSKGAFLNDQRIILPQIIAEKPKIIFNLSAGWKDHVLAEKIEKVLNAYNLSKVAGSFAVKECWVAHGKFNGVVTLAKDTFPQFASSLIIKEAGGILTNLAGEEDIRPDDRVFIGGDRATHSKLLPLVREVFRE